MKRKSRSACFSVVLLIALVLTLTQSMLAPPLAAAQAPPPPAQIASAKTVFLTNAGADPNFPIDSTESYNDVYAALKVWGRFELVSSADRADLVFELREVAPVTGLTGIDGDVSSYSSPAFQLSIRDPKTNAVLWTVTSPVSLAGRRQELARWITLSEANLISRIKVVSGEQLTAAEMEGLTTVPKLHNGRKVAILIGVTVGAAVAGALILHHEYENGLAAQKSSQDVFCQANHIPLSQCAGG